MNDIDKLLYDLTDETLFESSTVRTMDNPNFKRLCRIKEGVVENILRRLHADDVEISYFLLLSVITNHSPVSVEHRGNVPEMTKDWIKWGMEQNMDITSSKLRECIREKCLTRGQFTLSSGRQSPFYIECKHILLDANLLYDACSDMASLIKYNFPDAVNVAGVPLGGILLATGISLYSGFGRHCYKQVLVRKETNKDLEALPSENDNVVIVEDVVTTGQSVLSTAAKLKEGGFNPLGVVSIFDREEGGRENFKKAGLSGFYSLFVKSEFEEDQSLAAEQTDDFSERLIAGFAKATATAVADLRAKGLPAHGNVDGVWCEVTSTGRPKKPGEDQ